jgi:cysteine desulfurase
MARIFFDNSATTRVDPRVLTALLPYYETMYGNPSSLHQFGTEAHDALEEARERTARAIGAEAREIYFTSGGTESDNIALQGIAFANRKSGNHIITSNIEHHAILRTCGFLEKQGFRVTYLPVDRDGLVDPESVLSAINKETILISIMAANNEIGTIQPIRAIGQMAQEHGVPFHTDAVQATTKMPLDVVRDCIDLLSISAHKFHGPKGVGALFLRKGLEVRPLTYGGGQEKGIRPSTENIPGIVGLGMAIDIGIREMKEAVESMTAIRERLIDGTLSRVEECQLNGHRTKRLCNNVNLRFDNVEGEALVLRLDHEGIAASTGSACSARSSETSHVLKALGLSSAESRGALRLSLSKLNNLEEAEIFLEAIVKVVERLRAIVPARTLRTGSMRG